MSLFIAADAYKSVDYQARNDTRRYNFGDYQRYTHDELRSLPLPPPPPPSPLMMMNPAGRRYHPKYKTQRCNKLDQFGFCPYGDKCQFLHDEEDAAVLNGVSSPSLQDYLQVLLSPSIDNYLQYHMALPLSPPAIAAAAADWSPLSDHQTTFSNASSLNSPSTPQLVQKQHPNNCQTWKDARRCNIGDYQRYDELRSAPTSNDVHRHHPKYKTQRCNKLDQFGFCPYGDKCQFIHRDDDNMYTTPNVEQQQLQRQSTPRDSSNNEHWSSTCFNSWSSPIMTSSSDQLTNDNIDSYDDMFIDQFQSIRFDQQTPTSNKSSNERLPIFCSLTSKIGKYSNQP